jgi:hypothetical protein
MKLPFLPKKDSFMNISNGAYTHYNSLPFRIRELSADKKDINTLAVEPRKAPDRQSDAIDEVSKSWVPTPDLEARAPAFNFHV